MEKCDLAIVTQCKIWDITESMRGLILEQLLIEINDNQQAETNHKFSNYSYYASLSPCGSIGKSWGKYSSYFDTEM